MTIKEVLRIILTSDDQQLLERASKALDNEFELIFLEPIRENLRDTFGSHYLILHINKKITTGLL